MLKHKKNNKEQSNKQRNQRILHIYSSQSGQSEHLLKSNSIPLKKVNKPSITHHHNKSKEHHQKGKNKGHISTTKIKPPEIYQRIPIHFVNSNSNSQIQFSNYGETLKEAGRPLKKNLFINCDDQIFMRQMMNKEKKRIHLEQQSAVKIQKVFRGFMTRKLLQKYIEEYEEKLILSRNQIKRKTTFMTNSQQDSFYACELKNSYFLSNKKSNKKYQMGSQERDNLEFQSSIYTENDHYLSIQGPDLSEKPVEQERKEFMIDQSNLTLNESSIPPIGQQISLSFGQEPLHSPHFPQPSSLKKCNPNFVMESPQKRKHATSLTQDNTRDILSQNITISPNYYKHNRSKQDQSHLNSLQKEQQQILNIESGSKMDVLKSSQKAKWEKVIQFVNQNLKGTFTQDKTKQMMSIILNFSVQNREQLNKIAHQQHSKVTPTTITYRLDEEPHISCDRDNNIEKIENEDELMMNKVKKNENFPLVRKTKAEKISIFERTLIMKQYFLKNMHLEDSHIDKMMNLREAVLRRKESASLIQLNNLLQNNQLTQDQFLDRLFKLTHTFENHQKNIEQIKEDIYHGYKAQLSLLKNTALDAKYLGYNIPFCRSMEIFPNQPNWRFDSLMIDELNQLAQRKLTTEKQRSGRVMDQEFGTQDINNLMKDSPESQDLQNSRLIFQKSISEDEDDVSFTYEETNIYKQPVNFQSQKGEPIPFEVIQSPKNMKHVSNFDKFSAIAVFEQRQKIQKQQSLYEVQEPELQKSKGSSLKKQFFKFKSDSDSEDQQILFKASHSRNIEQVVDFYLKKLIWQLLEDILLSSTIYNSFMSQNIQQYPDKITNKQRVDFLKLCLKNLPQFQPLKYRLNQKMYPNLKEMLFSMREGDSQEDDQQYIEIGQYEYILNQEICFLKIQEYFEIHQRERKKIKSPLKAFEVTQDFKSEYRQLSTQTLKHAAFERKMEINKYRKGLQKEREQILRIELHMLIDVWNQELIKYRQNKHGYSGIGVNQLSLSLVDRICSQMSTEQEYRLMMQQTEQNIQNMIGNQDSYNYGQDHDGSVCKNDAQWILYTQQALQYGFDVVKIIELELIFQCLNQLHLIDDRIYRPYSHSGQVQISSQQQEQDQEMHKNVLRLKQVFQSEDEQDDSFYQ